jgi:hypothetical protein
MLERCAALLWTGAFLFLGWISLKSPGGGSLFDVAFALIAVALVLIAERYLRRR